ncbi:mitochondrial nucleoid-associated protein 1 isoform 2-T2 [Porphyrio hochstetteri]
MAAAPPGRELCPYCHRPFKRLRSHLPHCKAAPGPDPGLGPGQAAGPPAAGSRCGSAGAGSRPRAGAAGKSSERPPGPGVGQGLPGEETAAARKGKAAERGGGGSGPGLCRQPGGRGAGRKVEPAVRDAASSLGLLPEEVKDPAREPSSGAGAEKQRARVRGEASGSSSGAASAGSRSPAWPAGEGSHPGSGADRAGTAQPGTQERATVPEAAGPATRGLGAAEHPSAEGERSSSPKAIKIPVLGDPPEARSRSSPGDLVQQEGADKTVTEEKQMHLEAGVEYGAPVSALHTKNLHLSVMEGFRGHNKEASKNDLSSIQKHRGSKQQMAGVSEPILNARRDTELALDQFLLHTSKNQPICLAQASGRSTQARAVGLEWFPDLYPNYYGLSIFPGKPFQRDEGSTVKVKGSFSEGQRGPLSERQLMDVRLGELPAWLATCDFSPQGLLGGVQKAWSSYYNKYINVRKGGPAGISMLLAGYCLLSYGWNYQHIKHHRWRKYH